MGTYVKVVPTANAQSGKRFADWAEKVAKKWQLDRTTVMREELEKLLSEIISKSKIWTGASSGIKGEKKIYPSHPAFSMTVGNYFNGGQSGWQMGDRKINQHRTQLFIYNPMWNHYLKFVEKGMVPGAGGQDIVRTAWINFKSRIYAK